MRIRLAVAAIGLLAIFHAAPCPPAAAQGPGKPAGAGVVVLDTMGFWRMHQTLKPPMVQADGGPKPYRMGLPWLDQETAAVPAKWREADFDDSGWVRGTVLRAAATPYLDRLCLRGKFRVTDPSQVKDLLLSVDYQGGVVVYLNGREVGRGDRAIGGLRAGCRVGGGEGLPNRHPHVRQAPGGGRSPPLGVAELRPGPCGQRRGRYPLLRK